MQHATSTGIVLSGFGLSAFLFSTLAHTLFSGNTESFLLVLVISTALLMIIGFLFIRPIPFPASELAHPAAIEELKTRSYGKVDLCQLMAKLYSGVMPFLGISLI
jgi:hypothetical protein